MATRAAGIRRIGNVLGGSNNDLIIGDRFADILRGGAGRDLIIGGAGGDSLYGDSGEDVLIGGSTIHDLDDAALLAMMAEWGREDYGYSERIDHLRNGGGRNGRTCLTANEIVEDQICL